MTEETFNHSDRAGFLERLGRLAGSTTWREPGQGGGTPYAARRIPTEHAMALALAMARSNPNDVGPDVAFSVATGTAHRRAEVVQWLARKLVAGTGPVGRRSEPRSLSIAMQAYDMVIGARRHISPPSDHKAARDFELLVNIGAGWLWMAMEFAVERAENAMHRDAIASKDAAFA